MATDKIITEARERYEAATGSEEYTARMDTYRESLRYYDGDQWDRQTREIMRDAKRDPLTINRLAQPVQQVVNDQRQNRPAVRISPVDSGADKETARVFQGIVRHIEYRSGADAAYDTAFEYAAAGGFGFWRIVSEYADDDSFDQELCIRRVHDPETVIFDPNSREPDGRDAEYCFVTELISKDEHRRRWRKARVSSDGFFASAAGAAMGEWISDDFVLICEYWCVKHSSRTRWLLSTGKTAWKDEMPGGEYDAESGLYTTEDGQAFLVVREREADVRTVRQYIINGHEVLEESGWAGKWIPVVPCYGKEIYIEGKRKLRSMIWHARDAQRLFNSAVTSERETASLSPKAPWIGWVGQFETDKENWAMAALGMVPYLQADPVAVDGKALPLPQRNTFEPAIQALSILAAQSGDYIKATTGLMGPSLGEQDSNRSGRAIRALQEEGDTANFHLVDNLSRSIAHSGRILVDLIPKIYDRERMIRIIGEDQKQEVVRVAANFALAPGGDEMEQTYRALDDPGRRKYQEQRGYQIDVGRYDVTVSTGPGYQTRRQQSAAELLELGKLFPEQMSQALDIVIGSLDLVQGDEIRERVTPPEYREQDGGQDIPPEVRQQVAELEAAFQDVLAQLEEARKKIDAKETEGRIDLEQERMRQESARLIAEANNRARVMIALAGNDSAESIALLRAQMDQIGNLLDVEAAEASHGGSNGNGN